MALHLVILSGDLRCENLGDMAMLQSTVERLTALLPGVHLRVTTSNAAALAVHCPTVEPLEFREDWFAAGLLGGRLWQSIPGRLRRVLTRLMHRLWSVRPGLMVSLIARRMAGEPIDGERFKASFAAVRSSDAVVLCGAGGFGDGFEMFANAALTMLGYAGWCGKPAAMFSHGFVRMEHPDLLRRTGKVLRGLALVALREDRIGPALMTRIGVSPARICMTGDDAVVVAFRERAPELGDGVGLSLRISRNSGFDQGTLERLRPVMHAFLARRRVSLVPLAIAGQPHRDAVAIDQILVGPQQGKGQPWAQKTVTQLVRDSARCRVVVTGAYHAAVFALSQGIPAVCLSGSQYFRDKFDGLAGQFGTGCWVVDFFGPRAEEDLERAMDEAWDAAPRLRGALLEASVRQIRQSDGAYARFAEGLTGASVASVRTPDAEFRGASVPAESRAVGKESRAT